MGLQAGTHWDALAHVSHDGVLYNGHPGIGRHRGRRGASAASTRSTPIVSRGVLLDVPAAKGIERLEPGYAITAGRPRRRVRLAGVEVDAGDVVLVRTGQIQNLHAGDRMAYTYPSAGLLVVDRASGSTPTTWPRSPPTTSRARCTRARSPSRYLPVHLLHLVYMGLTQGQNFDLEALAADCAADGRYTFLLDASPQPFTGGLGSPVNPVVTK